MAWNTAMSDHCRSAGARRVAAVLLAVGVGAAGGPPELRSQERPGTAEADYYVYVAAESQDQVSVVRFGPAGTEVLKTIPVGMLPTEIDGPHGIAVDPDGRRWYVSIAHGMPYGEIHSYAAGMDEPRGRVRAGLFPASMDITPAGLLFVVNFNLHGDPVPSSVSVVETESMVEMTQIPTCVRPHGSRLTADGRRHYSGCVGDDQLVEIDTRGLRVSRRLFLGPGRERPLPPGATRAADVVGAAPGGTAPETCGPTWAQPEPEGRFVYVACNRNREVLEVDLETWSVRRRFSTGAGPYNLDVTPDGRLLVVTYKGGEATGIFDLAAGSELAAIPSTRRLPHGIALSPDSRYAFISVEGIGSEPGAVDVIDLRALRMVGSADVGRQAGGIGFWKTVPVGEGSAAP